MLFLRAPMTHSRESSFGTGLRNKYRKTKKNNQKPHNASNGTNARLETVEGSRLLLRHSRGDIVHLGPGQTAELYA